MSSQVEPAADSAPALPAEQALGTRAVRGAALTFMRYGGAQALRLLANLIVTRLVAPEAMGVMALVNVVIQGLEMFSDIGIGPSIIRSKRGDEHDFLDTIWTVQLLRGTAIWLVSCLAAVPFAAYFEEPMLAQLLPVAGLNAVFSSLSPTKRWTLNRHLQLGRLMILDLAAQLFGLLLMIGLAYQWRSAWALVFGSIGQTAAGTFLGYVYLPGRNNRVRWEREARSELFGFGGWVFVSTMLTFLSQSADRLIFGKLLTMGQLGVYSIGKQMSSAPTEAVSHIGSAVVFPYYSRVVTNEQPLAPVFVSARHPLLVLSGYGLSMLAAIGSALVDLLYDDRYRAGGWVVQVLALGAWFSVLWTTNVAALLALGHSKWMAATTAVKTVAIIVLVPIGVYLHGFHGAVVALALTEVIQLCFSSLAVYRNGLAPWWQDIPMSGYVMLAAAAGWWLSAQLTASSWLALLIGCAVVTLMWLPMGWPLLRKLLRREGPLFGERA